MPKAKKAARKPRPAAYLHVNGHTLRRNRRTGDGDPPVAVRLTRSGPPAYHHRVEIKDRDGNTVAVLAYTPARPLGCGATVYVTCVYAPAASPAQSTRRRGARSTGMTP